MSTPKEGRWLARPLKTRLSYYNLHGVVMPIYTATAIGYIFTHPHLPRLPMWITLLHFWCAVAAIVYYFSREYRCLRLTKGDIAHMERPEGIEEFPVEITVCNKTVVGCDRGVLYFDGPHLGFVGGRSSFLIAANDLDLPTKNVLTTLDLPYRPLKLRASGGEASISVRPLLGFARPFRRRLKRFLLADEASFE